MKKTLLFVLALAVIPVGVDAQAPDLEEMRALAEQGNANAQLYLGVLYARGDGVPEDDAEAARWLRLAAEQGNALAQYNLGFIYDSGRGVASVHKLISLAQHSTRKHYPGAHRVEVMLNGTAHPRDDFEVRLRGLRQV